jgi:hypothetical protein
MKNVRFVTLALALVLLVTAVIPLAAQPASLQTLTYYANGPVQALVDATRGLPLLAPMSIGVGPALTVSVESVSAASDYSCSLVSQKPKDWTKMRRRQYFDAVWAVRNTGSKNWGNTSVDFAYVKGTKMHTHGDSYDLASDVGPGKKVTLTVDMTSPKTRGYYTETWGLYKGNKVFCRVSVTINVNR